jgi:hypothetical protein
VLAGDQGRDLVGQHQQRHDAVLTGLRAMHAAVVQNVHVRRDAVERHRIEPGGGAEQHFQLGRFDRKQVLRAARAGHQGLDLADVGGEILHVVAQRHMVAIAKIGAFGGGLPLGFGDRLAEHAGLVLDVDAHAVLLRKVRL